jgi:hypothetical protein
LLFAESNADGLFDGGQGGISDAATDEGLAKPAAQHRLVSVVAMTTK